VSNGRERDVLYLDLALEAAVRTAVETSLGVLSSRPAVDVLKATGLALESLALSAGSNGELVLCLKEWRAVQAAAARGDGGSWALRAKAVADRLRMSLAVRAHATTPRARCCCLVLPCLQLTTTHPRMLAAAFICCASHSQQRRCIPAAATEHG
jgi:hypothetical protein